ncbi:hypothetical protein HPP92_022858 [Vanilla planifolia]|uniref:BZIP domain-containing protein n=1 Tax=Vanilla planifolia TaxID=51239 RepID=A0A835UG33_VANPL|nr:hypothetical protein HPP92_022858 [Vanilla planifolia]
MASPNGTCSGSSSPFTNSGLDEDLQAEMDRKKRKRMLSNRESARRSRMRKQQHLDELTADASLLNRENGQLRTNLSLRTHHCLAMEAQNAVLRTRAWELASRLNSLNEIRQYLFLRNTGAGASDGLLDILLPNLQPMMMAPQDMFRY